MPIFRALDAVTVPVPDVNTRLPVPPALPLRAWPPTGTVAAVADAPTGEIFAAERDNGAWGISAADGVRRLAVGTSPAIIVLDPGKSSGERRDCAARTTAAAIRAERWEVAALGTTLALAYAAAGRTAACVVFSASAVHTAAGVLLCTEAGGVVSDIDGEPWNVDSDSTLVAATPSLHAELVALARSASAS